MSAHVPKPPSTLAIPSRNCSVSQLQSMPTDVGRNVLLDQLHYRHEILVGGAIQRFSRKYRGQNLFDASAKAIVYQANPTKLAATKKHDNIVQATLDAMWVPDYTEDAR